MKFFGVFLLLLAPLFLVNIALAGPPQRLIIQFDTSLNHEQKQVLNEKIQLIIKTEYTLLPHSTDQRWIINIDPALNKTDLNRVTEAITKLEIVTYAELDQLLKVFH